MHACTRLAKRSAAGKMGRLSVVKWCLIFCCFLQLGSAQEISCIATQHADQTIYNISAESCVPDVDVPKCDYSWATLEEVLAHMLNHSVLVITNTINSLSISGCFDSVILKRHCDSERKEIKVFCMINCTQHLHLGPGKGGKEIPHDQPAWITPVVLVVVTLVVLGLLGFLCYRYKEHISRNCRHVYDLVRMENGDVEAGNT